MVYCNKRIIVESCKEENREAAEVISIPNLKILMQ